MDKKSIRIPRKAFKDRGYIRIPMYYSDSWDGAALEFQGKQLY